MNETNEVLIHPLALLSIIHGYERRGMNVESIIGTLFGTRIGSRVEICDAFIVPFTTNKNMPINIKVDFAKEFAFKYRRLNVGQTIVGWFSTNAKISSIDIKIHEFYARNSKNPILLTVDMKLTNNRLNIKAFSVSSFGIKDKTFGGLFYPIEVKITLLPEERVAYEYLKDALYSPSDVMNHKKDFEAVFHSFVTIKNGLGLLLDYVTRTILNNHKIFKEGKIKPDPTIGRKIIETFDSIPKINYEEMETMFDTEQKILLSVTFLLKFIKCYLPMHDTVINMTVDNAV